MEQRDTTQRQLLMEMARNNHGVISVPIAKKMGIPTGSIKKLAHDYDDIFNVARGVYVWYDDDFDLEYTNFAQALAVAPEGSALWGYTTLAFLGLGALSSKTYEIGVPGNTKRNATTNKVTFTKIPDGENGDIKIYDGFPSQNAFDALKENKTHFGKYRFETAIDEAIERKLISRREGGILRE